MMHIPNIELQPADAIQFFQLEKVKETLQYVALHSPFYKRMFASKGIDVDDIRSLTDFATIPTTTKDDFHTYNWDFLCVPKPSVAEYTSTSGTLGGPVTIALTINDVKRLAYNECISFACADGIPEDLFQLMLTLDRQFMAGIAYYEGIRQLGAGLIRVGPGLPAMQWDIIQRLSPTAIVAVPSFIVKLLAYADEQGIDPANCSVRKAICIGESIRTTDFQLNALGRKIVNAWDIQLYGTYASTEMQTAFTECNQGMGGHHHPELIYVELLDDNNNPVAPGVAGEVTVTSLGIEAMPLLRYRTGDIAVAHTLPCACGRTTMRLGPVIGRKKQMIKLKGTTLYPPAIFEVISHVEGIEEYVIEVRTGELSTDELIVHVQSNEHDQTTCADILRDLFQSRLRVVPTIVFESKAAIEQLQTYASSRKVNRFLDRRLPLF